MGRIGLGVGVRSRNECRASNKAGDEVCSGNEAVIRDEANADDDVLDSSN